MHPIWRVGKVSIAFWNYSNTYVDKGNSHGQAHDPRGLFFEEPSQFLHATVIEGITGDGVPALGGQGLLEGEIVTGTICSAASNL